MLTCVFLLYHHYELYGIAAALCREEKKKEASLVKTWPAGGGMFKTLKQRLVSVPGRLLLHQNWWGCSEKQSKCLWGTLMSPVAFRLLHKNHRMSSFLPRRRLQWICFCDVPGFTRDKTRKTSHFSFICCLMDPPVTLPVSYLFHTSVSPPWLIIPLSPMSQLIMVSSSHSLCLYELTGYCVLADRVAVIHLDRLAATLCKQPLVIHESVQHPWASINPYCRSVLPLSISTSSFICILLSLLL